MSNLRSAVSAAAFVALVIAAGFAFLPVKADGDSCGSPITAVNTPIPEGKGAFTQAGARACREAGRDRLITAGFIGIVGLVGCAGAADYLGRRIKELEPA